MYLVSVLFTFYIQGVLKLKKIIPARKVNRTFSPEIILRTLPETLKYSCKSIHVQYTMKYGRKEQEKVTPVSESRVAYNDDDDESDDDDLKAEGQ